MFGLARTDAASGSLLLNLEGLATMAIAWVVFRENVDRRLLLGAFAILAGRGAAVLAGPRRRPRPRRAADRRRLPRLGHRQQPDPQAVRGRPGADRHDQGAGRRRGQPGSGAGSGRASAGSRAPSLAAGVVGFLGYGVSLVLFVLALRHLGTARTGAYFSLAPFIGAVLAILLLRRAADAAPADRRRPDGASASGCIWPSGTSTSTATSRRARAPAHATTSTIGTRMRRTIRRASRTPIWHRHAPLRHKHPHYPDLHHRHGHG